MYMMAESHCCPTKTITTLLIGYMPIQNKKFIYIYARISLAGRTRKFGIAFEDRGRVKMKNHIHYLQYVSGLTSYYVYIFYY